MPEMRIWCYEQQQQQRLRCQPEQSAAVSSWSQEELIRNVEKMTSRVWRIKKMHGDGSTKCLWCWQSTRRNHCLLIWMPMILEVNLAARSSRHAITMYTVVDISLVCWFQDTSKLDTWRYDIWLHPSRQLVIAVRGECSFSLSLSLVLKETSF